MEIQQTSICKQSIQKMLADPKKYRKIMMIMMQTLHNLGYEQTAKQLQVQSKVTYITEQLKQLSNFLNEGSLLEAIQQLDKINQNCFTPQKKNRIKQMIYESQCLRLIIQGQMQQALKIVQTQIKDQNSKQKVCQLLILGSSEQISYSKLIKKNQQIFSCCLQYFQQIGKNQIDKVIQSYSCQQKEGRRDIKKLFNIQKQYPPNRLLSSQQSQHFDKPISHIKINQLKSEVVCVSQTKTEKQISIFELNSQNINSQKAFKNSNISTIRNKYSIFTLRKKIKINNLQHAGQKQTVQSILYLNQSVIICTYAFIIFFNRNLQETGRIICQNKSQRNLFIQVNPLSSLVYASGYYTKLKVYDQKGEQINQIQPFPKTRKFIFSSQNYLIGINCVAPKIFKYNIFEQRVQIQKQMDSTIMDICYHPQKKVICICTFRNIAIINSTNLQQTYKFIGPQNPTKVLVQLSFFRSYLIVLCKNFKAYKGSPDMNYFTFQKEWPGEGIFDIYKSIMISGNKQLLCWTQGNIDYQREQQISQSEEQNRYQDVQQISEQSLSQQNQDDNSDSEVDLELS